MLNVIRPGDKLPAVHPVAEYFPMMDGAAYAGHRDDIRTHGQRETVKLSIDGQLVDGRNRLKACQELGIDCMTEVVGDPDLTSYIISENLYRRHLNDNQRARIGAKLATRSAGNQAQFGQMAELKEVIPTQNQVAELLNVPARTIRKARAVAEQGVVELNELFDEGKVSLHLAERVAKGLSVTEQREYVEQVRAGGDPVTLGPKATSTPARSNKVTTTKMTTHVWRKGEQLKLLASVTSQCVGLLFALGDVAQIDDNITDDEATQLRKDFSAVIKEFNRVHELLKKRGNKS